MRLTPTLLLLLCLGGCGVPVAVVTGALGFGVSAFDLDGKLIDAWLATKGQARVTKTPVPPAPQKSAGLSWDNG